MAKRSHCGLQAARRLHQASADVGDSFPKPRFGLLWCVGFHRPKYGGGYMTSLALSAVLLLCVALIFKRWIESKWRELERHWDERNEEIKNYKQRGKRV